MTASGEPSPAAPAADDAALVARVAARDPAALREVIARHAGALHRIAWRMTGDAYEAEDIVQEACLRLWDHAPRLAARHPAGTTAASALRLSGWLARVVTNLAIDRLRLARRVSGEDVPDRADDAPLADARIEGQRARRRRPARWCWRCPNASAPRLC